ncbi:MAG: ankyrin repeat domain-containing protein, partial [Thiobacillaceae bacterium]
GLAALRGHARIARMLLRAGANVDLKGADGNTPLFLAAWLNRTEVVRELLAYRPDFTLPNKGYSERAPMFDPFLITQRPHFYRPDELLNRYEGLTALGIAALENSVGALGLMLEAGADPHFRDRGGLDALFYAIYRRHRAAADLLLARGADPGYLNVDF